MSANRRRAAIAQHGRLPRDVRDWWKTRQIEILTLPPEAQKMVFQAIAPASLVELTKLVRAKEMITALRIGPQKGYTVSYGSEKRIVGHFDVASVSCRPANWQPEPQMFLTDLKDIMEMLPGTIRELNLTSDDYIPVFIQKFGQQYKYCDELVLRADVPSRSLRKSLSIKEISVQKQLTIVSMDAFPELEPMQVPRLVLDDHQFFSHEWSSPEQLVEYNQKFVLIKTTSFDTEQFRKVISTVLKSKKVQAQTEWFEIGSIFDIDLDEIMKPYVDMEMTATWNPATRDAFFSQFQGRQLVDLDCRSGYDIPAPTGTLFTFLKTCDENGMQSLHIIIWQTPFPNARNIQKLLNMRPSLVDREMEIANAQRRIEENEQKIERNEEVVARLQFEINLLLEGNLRGKPTRLATIEKNIIEPVERLSKFVTDQEPAGNIEA